MADQTVTQHQDLAAFHLYEMGRATTPDQPDWQDEESAHARTAFRYAARGAARREDSQCVLLAIERMASALAATDGEPWPECNRAINPDWPELKRLAVIAHRRQRYRHLARVAHSAGVSFYDLGTEDAAYRSQALSEVHASDLSDKRIAAAYRATMPSNQEPK